MCPGGNFEAQIFGGGELDTCDKTGEENVEIARKVLNKKGVNIVSEDVGGEKGRKILFDTDTGHVAVLKVYDVRDVDWS